MTWRTPVALVSGIVTAQGFIHNNVGMAILGVLSIVALISIDIITDALRNK